MISGHSLFVLVVGIDEYINPVLRPLEGAVRDAELMTDVFRNHFAVPDDNIVTLTNSAATRDGITKTFHEHLTARAKAAVNTDDEPSFVFFYAGHGSRSRDKSGTQPDGKDETIVPHDSRTEGIFDIKDWELAGWLDELTTYTQNITIILDCCHSGSGTRDDGDIVGTDRQCPPDLREQPTARPATTAPATRSTAPMTTGAQEKYTLLAACRNDQSAKEYSVGDGEDCVKHGAYTWFLAEELMSLTPGIVPTCREVHERVKHRVHRKFRSQVPQCEGDRDRLLFGGVNAVREPLMSVCDIKRRDGSIWIDGGIVHGITNGAKLKLYPPETRTVAPTTPVVGGLTVTKAGAVRSLCTADNGIKVKEFSRVALATPGIACRQRSVAIQIDDRVIKTELMSLLQNSGAAPYIDVSADAESAEFVLTMNDEGEIETRATDGSLFTEPVPNDQVQLVTDDLAALCRYQNVLDLQNRSRTSDLRGRIRVTFHQVVDPSDDDESPDEHRRVRSVAPIRTTSDGVPIVEMGTPIAIEIHNDWTKPVYCEAISFGYDYAIVPLTELVSPGSRKRVTPGETIWFGRDHNDALIKFMLPGDAEAARQFSEAREFLKIVATEEEADYEVLRQGGLRVPLPNHRAGSDSALDQLLAMTMHGTRALGVERVKADDNDWTTVTQEYLVTKPTERKRHTVAGGTMTEVPEFDVAIQPPAGLDCSITVLTESETVRSTTTNRLTRPGSLALNSEFVKPLPLISQRCTGIGGEAIEIEADADALALISEENPIRLRLPPRPAETTLAVAWDGEFPYFAGVSNPDGEVHIGWLPSIDSQPDADSVDGDGNRNLVRAARLYFYRVRNEETPETGLYRAEFVREGVTADLSSPPKHRAKVDTGRVVYFDAAETDFQEGQKTALLINGFPSGSETLVEDLWELLTDRGYDHVLTFDYEAYSTQVANNGAVLFQQLVTLGFAKNDNRTLDVIAHGTGAIVARTMIELETGRQFVDRCFCIGSPNQGTSLMKVKEAFCWIGTSLLLQSFRGSLLAGFVGQMLRKTSRDGKGFNDLAVNSPFLERLGNKGKRGPVHYHLIAGEYAPLDKDGSVIQRLWQQICRTGKQAVSQIFGDEHDLFVNTPSMLQLSKNPAATGAESSTKVTCHHFEYFSNPSAVDQIAAKL